MLGRNGQNICDVPVIAKETVRFEFVGDRTSSDKPDISTPATLKTTEYTLSNPRESTIINKKHWWWLNNATEDDTRKDTTEANNDNAQSNLNSNGGISNKVLINGKVENKNKINRDGFDIHTDRKKNKIDPINQDVRNINQKESKDPKTLDISKTILQGINTHSLAYVK